MKILVHGPTCGAMNLEIAIPCVQPTKGVSLLTATFRVIVSFRFFRLK